MMSPFTVSHSGPRGRSLLARLAVGSALLLGGAGTVLAESADTTPSSASPSFGPLVDPAALPERVDGREVVVLDIRTGADEDGVSVYEQGHLPGARHAPYGIFRGPSDNPGHRLSDAELTEVLQSLGLTGDEPVVVAHAGTGATDFGAAARVYWTLQSAGFEDLAILDGGYAAWTEDSERPLRTEVVPVAPSDAEFALSDEWLATREDVRRLNEDPGKAILLDARPVAFFEGETQHPAAARPGTIPGSSQLTHSVWFASEESPRFSLDEARRIAAEQGLVDQAEVVSFCNSGHWAATNWFVLSEVAGVDGVKLYPESMVGWSHAGLPMENTPGVLKNFLQQLGGGKQDG